MKSHTADRSTVSTEYAIGYEAAWDGEAELASRREQQSLERRLKRDATRQQTAGGLFSWLQRYWHRL